MNASSTEGTHPPESPREPSWPCRTVDSSSALSTPSSKTKPDPPVTPPDDDGPAASAEAAGSYQEKIVIRKCLNALVDIRVGLTRQNRLLERLLRELEAARERRHDQPSI